MPSGFNRYNQDYAQFCAFTPERRVYYMVNGGTIVETKLDYATWKPTGMVDRPKRSAARSAGPE